MLIAHLSDTHIVDDNESLSPISSMSHNLSECINYINGFIPKIDLVMISGDIVNSAKYSEYLKAYKLFCKFKIPFYVLPGNHDNPKTLKVVFKEHFPCLDESIEVYDYIIEEYDLRILALDSSQKKHAGGNLSTSQLDWLDRKLSEQPLKPSVIFLHHMPVNIGISETDIDGFIGKEKLASIVQSNSQIKTIACGHVHLKVDTLWQGTLVSSAPSIGLGLVLEMNLDLNSKFILSKPMFQLIQLNKENNLACFNIIVDQNNISNHFN